jgi:hypothetical protein
VGGQSVRLLFYSMSWVLCHGSFCGRPLPTPSPQHTGLIPPRARGFRIKSRVLPEKSKPLTVEIPSRPPSSSVTRRGGVPSRSPRDQRLLETLGNRSSTRGQRVLKALMTGALNGQGGGCLWEGYRLEGC